MCVCLPVCLITGQYKMQTADQVQNADRRLQTGYKMQTDYLINKYAIECHFITYLVSHNHQFLQTLALLWNIRCLCLNILCLKQSGQATVVLK